MRRSWWSRTTRWCATTCWRSCIRSAIDGFRRLRRSRTRPKLVVAMESGLARRGHHDPDQIGSVTCPELLHDIGAVVLDGPRTDPEMPTRLLVGGAGSELLEHFAF